ncbi:FxSxx-COOH system tetratricopeptide repeat protein [Streptomyces sp. VRA16 Mangrove soil]|uniref:FxSxx-COOH system tetratricopeptide repeat protein n=1 Tax=Streptomyces sp. VRA16 Mangrove soil TaxID=2817434 RepID=UPI001A9EE453|nr:FxSxx-COOH system tetratricopeptide repeat protein [Streptomyces sp. VRA16 Mangrove soil]MBO1330021.1 tetratricopeptide repeat protein [Streptomyces sp. VRA16 Mangrove soil]
MPAAHLPERSGPFTVFFTTSENLGLSTTLRNAADIVSESRRSVLIVDARTGRDGAGDPVPEPDPGTVAFVRRPEAASLVALADDPVAAAYDLVLIEAPVPDSVGAAEPAALAALGDAFVFCFALSAWSIDGAAALAEELAGHRDERPYRMLTLGLKSYIGVGDRLRDARERVRRRFGALAQALGDSEVPFLEIPFNPLYQDSRRLAVDREDSGTVAGLRPYYEQLADWLRERSPRQLTAVSLVHGAGHVPWAAWLRDCLEGRGIATTLLRSDTYGGEQPGPGQALLFLSPGDDPTLLPKIGALSHPDVRIVLVDESFAQADAAHHERIDLRELAEDEALQTLYAGLGVGAAPFDDTTPRARFPRLPKISNLMARNGEFVDRPALVDRLDESLREAARAGSALVLHGPSGWGKSEVAWQLCHQYGSGYDVVWWVRSWETQRMRRGLTGLANLLDTAEDRLGTADDDAGTGQLLRRLSDPDSGVGRWLVVYDGVAHPDDLEGALPVPHERGHVLITSRRPPDDGDPATAPFAVPRMAPEECAAVLREMAPEITTQDALRIGGVLDFVPMALRLAAFCLGERVAHHHREGRHEPATVPRTAVADVLDQFRSAKTGLLTRADSAPPIEVMVLVARRLAQDTPGAAAWQGEAPGRDALGWLLNAASLLTGRGMGLELLRSRRILSELARDDSTGAAQPADGRPLRHPDDVQLPDEHMVSVALWSLAQVGLIDVDFDRAQQPLVQHHVLRDVIRASMTQRERADVESVLRSILAEYVPHEDKDLPADWAREVTSLRLWEDPRPRVRRSLLRHLTALNQRGESADLTRVLDIGGRALDAWAAPGDEQAPEYLSLLNRIARAHRLRGDYDSARTYSEQALRGHRRLLGLVHPRTLLSADSHAATLRALGRFDDALMQSRPSLEGLTLLLGRHHTATVQVEHNLALTEALTGRYDAALTLLQDRFRHRQAVGGKDDPLAWRSADLLAYLYRAVGRDGESRDLLRQFLRRHGDVWDGARLKVEVGLAISERRIADMYPSGAKDPMYGFERAHARDAEALGLYVRQFGSRRLETLRCQFSLAADLHALGKFGDAEHQARTCVESLTDTLGAAHPYTGLGQVRHGVYLRALGDTDGAVALGRAAVNSLAHKLGRNHPWVSAAENSLAASLAAAGQGVEATELAYSALTRLRDLGMAHRPLGRRVRAHHAWLSGSDPGRVAPPTGFDIDLELPGL